MEKNMNVRMIAKTQPVIEGIDNLEEYIAYVARVSNPDNQMNNETSNYLLQYLIRNRHWSPFEMASMTLEIKTTRDIGRQILRHRSFSFQEFSQRYAEVNLDELLQYREARLQDKKNRQNSIVVDDSDLQTSWNVMQHQAYDAASKAYQWALDHDIAKEQARIVLPEGLTPTTLYMAGTVRSWIHYIRERTENGVQKEHRDIAFGCMSIIRHEIPSIADLVLST